MHGNSSEATTHIDPIVDEERLIVYQFEIPQFLCGRLIGVKGSFVARIKQETNTKVIINRHNFASDLKICTLNGIFLALNIVLL